MPRRYTVTQELAFWRRQAIRTRVDRAAFACMILTFVVGLLAVWSA